MPLCLVYTRCCCAAQLRGTGATQALCRYAVNEVMEPITPSNWFGRVIMCLLCVVVCKTDESLVLHRPRLITDSRCKGSPHAHLHTLCLPKMFRKS